jgi:hypothetical protein
MVVRLATEFLYSGLESGWSKERCCKSDGVSCNFDGVGSESPTVGGGPYENCFTLSASGGWVSNQRRF